MSENCTELKNLRSLVRVCEIQATLREQRSAHFTFSYTRACDSHVHIHIQCTNLTLPLFLLTGYCFWDNKLKNLKSWRIKIPSWFEELWVCDVVLKQEERGVGEWVGKTHFVHVEPWRTKVLLRSALYLSYIKRAAARSCFGSRLVGWVGGERGWRVFWRSCPRPVPVHVDYL